MDYQEIEALFSEALVLPKYKKKRWIKIQDDTRGNYGNVTAINYHCKTVADKLVDYSEGYILVTGYIEATNAANHLAAGNHITIKNGTNSIISEAIVRFNNNEVEKCRYIYLTTTYLNLLEYSDDYSKNALQYAFAKDDMATAEKPGQADDADPRIYNRGLVLRREAINTTFANHLQNVLLKIPLKYISTFFRRLEFPIINNELGLEITLRGDNCLLRPPAPAVVASKLVITSTELYLPEVELTKEYEKQLSNKLSSSFIKELVWDHLNVYEIAGMVDGQFDREIVPSLNGVRKMYVMAIPHTDWNNQEHVDTSSAIKLRNINITIDSVDHYPQDIRNDHEAYALLQECFNMAGKDYNTGSLISFVEFKNLYRLYAFDLSRQEIFQSDPKKSQAIRLRCEIGIQAKLIVVFSQEKTAQICMNDPNKTRVI